MADGRRKYTREFKIEAITLYVQENLKEICCGENQD